MGRVLEQLSPRQATATALERTWGCFSHYSSAPCFPRTANFLSLADFLDELGRLREPLPVNLEVR